MAVRFHVAAAGSPLALLHLACQATAAESLALGLLTWVWRRVFGEGYLESRAVLSATRVFKAGKNCEIMGERRKSGIEMVKNVKKKVTKKWEKKTDLKMALWTQIFAEISAIFEKTGKYTCVSRRKWQLSCVPSALRIPSRNISLKWYNPWPKFHWKVGHGAKTGQNRAARNFGTSRPCEPPVCKGCATLRWI